MTNGEAYKELDKILAEWDSKTAPPLSLRARIDALYYAVCRKHLPTCKCRDRVGDALHEIYYNLKNGISMNETKTIMRRGIVIWWDGKPYSAANITDNVARAYLEKYPESADYFDALPDMEQGEPDPVQAEPTAEETTAPKAKKSKKSKK